MTDGPRLALFDIDGTLIRCGPQIRAIFQSALEDTFGTAGPIDTYNFAGRTDFGIVCDLLTAAGLERARVVERMSAFERLYLERLDERLEASRMTLLPGVRALLEELSGRSDVLLGLLTGNFERGARIKLSRLGLDGYFPFGAYGDRVPDRRDLPPVALERASDLHRVRCVAERTLIIGDSVLDVDCARQHGIRCVAVTTGFATREELVDAGADCVLNDLTEVDRCGDFLASGAEPV